MTLLIDNDATRRVIEMDETLDAIEDAFAQLGAGNAAFQPRTDLYSPTATVGDLFVWGSLLGAIRHPPRLAFRYKPDVYVWEDHPDAPPTQEIFNVEPGTYGGFMLLFDTSTGELLGLMNDGVLQHYRVGATAGVACKHLARADATTVGMLGSGGMARTYAMAFAAVRDLSHISVYSPTESHREAYAEEMAAELGLEVTPASSAREAVSGADIVSVCTDAVEPVFTHDMLEAGQFVVNVKTQDVDDETFEAVDRVLTTNNRLALEYHVNEADEREAVPEGFFEYRHQETAYPTLAEVISGDVPGRRDAAETVFYYNMSAGIQFAAVGDLVHRKVQEAGLGTPLPLAWFQQDVRN